MTLVVDATPGGSAANSFCTLAEAETFQESRVYITEWTASTTAEKNAALVMATFTLSTALLWNGYIYSSTQRLIFPRVGLYDRRGIEVPHDSVPDELKEATAELALQLRKSNPNVVSEAVAEGLTFVKTGPVELHFDLNVALGAKLSTMLDLILPILPEGWVRRKYLHTGTRPLVRA